MTAPDTQAGPLDLRPTTPERLDHGTLNLPLHKRGGGDLDAQIARWKAQQQREAKAATKATAAATKAERAAAKRVLAELSGERLAQIARERSVTPAKARKDLARMAHWLPGRLIALLGRDGAPGGPPCVPRSPSASWSVSRWCAATCSGCGWPSRRLRLRCQRRRRGPCRGLRRRRGQWTSHRALPWSSRPGWRAGCIGTGGGSERMQDHRTQLARDVARPAACRLALPLLPGEARAMSGRADMLAAMGKINRKKTALRITLWKVSHDA